MNKRMWAAIAFAMGLSVTDAMASGLPGMKTLGINLDMEENSMVAVRDNVGRLVSQRPEIKDRLFKSDAVEKKIKEIKGMLKNPYLAWMFENCFPNTLDTTVHFRKLNGKPDTFVYTGDIHAMWFTQGSSVGSPTAALGLAQCWARESIRAHGAGGTFC